LQSSPGDGIGPEVTQEATNILRAVAELGGHDFTFTPPHRLSH
jgi:3-isopropylmalate dehydrogenase